MPISSIALKNYSNEILKNCQMQMNASNGAEIKCKMRRNKEKHSETMDASWLSFEEEILKNLTISRDRAKAIERTKNETKVLQKQIPLIQEKAASLKEKINELKNNIDQKKILLEQQTNYITGHAPLPKKEYSHEDKVALSNEQALYDCVKYSTRTKWDMEAPESILRGYTFDPIKLIVEPFAETVNQNNEEEIQDRLWGKINKMQSFSWPVMDYKLVDDIDQITNIR